MVSAALRSDRRESFSRPFRISPPVSFLDERNASSIAEPAEEKNHSESKTSGRENVCPSLCFRKKDSKVKTNASTLMSRSSTETLDLMGPVIDDFSTSPVRLYDFCQKVCRGFAAPSFLTSPPSMNRNGCCTTTSSTTSISSWPSIPVD